MDHLRGYADHAEPLRTPAGRSFNRPETHTGPRPTLGHIIVANGAPIADSLITS